MNNYIDGEFDNLIEQTKEIKELPVHVKLAIEDMLLERSKEIQKLKETIRRRNVLVKQLREAVKMGLRENQIK
jgi:hypothetical protein